jgi:DNA-binding MarR family transcriptional regulator
MERRVERELEILTAIAEGDSTTQRALAARLGVALGLTNLYLKRLVKKGYVKVVGFPTKPAARKRLRYLLTARGIAEKSRLTYDHMVYGLNLYRRARQTLRESLSQLPRAGMKRVALYGTGEAAELAYLTLKEFALEPVGIYAAQGDGHFLGLPVQAVAELADEPLDAVVIATFERPEPHLAELIRLGVPRPKILTLRTPAPSAEARRS